MMLFGCTRAIFELKGDNVNGDLQFHTQPPPHKINTPEPIDRKFGKIDYVREGTSYTKFGRNPSAGGFWENG